MWIYVKVQNILKTFEVYVYKIRCNQRYIYVYKLWWKVAGCLVKECIIIDLLLRQIFKRSA